MFIDWDERPARCWTQVQQYTGSNKPVFDNWRDWPGAALEALDNWEDVARSRNDHAEPVAVDHHVTLGTDGFWYFERSLHFAIAPSRSRDGEIPAGQPSGREAAGGSGESGAAGFSDSLQRLVAGAAPA